MRFARPSMVASIASGICFGLGATSLWFAITVPAPAGTTDEVSRIPRILAACWSLLFGPLGLLILARRAGNKIGLVALGLAFSFAFTLITGDLSTLLGGPGSQPGLAVMLLSGIGWLVWISLFSWFLLLFPNGHLPSRRWRPFGWVLALWPPLYLIAALLAPQTVNGGAPAPNPYVTIGGMAGEVLNLVLTALNVLVYPLLIGGLVATIVRFRHSRGREHQQLKWLAYWASLTVGAAVLSVAIPNPATVLVANLSILGLPITVAIAIFRYRLYDIDLLIKRTFVYGVTSAAIAGSFFLGIIALQSVLRPFTSGSELAIAASTLVSFALFQPIRHRVQSAVDQRFDRSRYDAARTVDAFAEELRDEVDIDALRAELLGAVARTMAPAHASLWLRERIA